MMLLKLKTINVKMEKVKKGTRFMKNGVLCFYHSLIIPLTNVTKSFSALLAASTTSW